MFPADDGPILREIMTGKCTTSAGELLAAPNAGSTVNAGEFDDVKEEAHKEVLNGVVGAIASPLDMPINTFEIISSDNYDLIGETGVLTIGALPFFTNLKYIHGFRLLK